MIYELYMKKENRDKRYKELKKEGRIVRRFSDKNQLLHPMYVEDYPNKEIKEDCNIGNSYYKTQFSILYGIEEI